MELLRQATLDNAIANFTTSCNAEPELLQQILDSWETDQLIWPGNYVRDLLQRGKYAHALYIYCSEQDKIADKSPTHAMIMAACGHTT